MEVLLFIDFASTPLIVLDDDNFALFFEIDVKVIFASVQAQANS